MINVGVIGVGSIGSHHARIFSEISGANLTGVADTDFKQAKKIASKYNCKAYKDYSGLITAVDAVTIAVPTTAHFKIALDCLKKNKDILIEKPITPAVHDAEKLIAEAKKRNLIIQVGHLERFNAGLALISSMTEQPQLIEAMRLSPFLKRSIDIDVTLDLMIHDIDIILSLIKSEITDLRATGAKVLTDNIDIAYAWLEFKNGCIAEVVSSRVAAEKIRQLKVVQKDTCLTLNYQTQEVSRYRKSNGKIKKETRKSEIKEPLKEQLVSFVECVRKRVQPVVSGAEGKKALQIVLRISEMIRHGN